MYQGESSCSHTLFMSLKMSSIKIKSKESKGKQKTLPKLKAILANPHKQRCPVLNDAELLQLKFLLQSAIRESKLEPKAFATKYGVCLGLESSLRRINNKTSSCVFISLSIRPTYVLNLIARNAESKDETQPVFAQPKLENFIEEIFNIRALCMVFPKDLQSFNEKLNNWVEQRRKAVKSKNVPLATTKIRKKNISKAENIVELEDSTPEINHIKECQAETDKIVKPWSRDYLSFENKNHKLEPKLNDEEAVDALTQIIDSLPTSASVFTKEKKLEDMEIDSTKGLLISKKESDDTDSDDFLCEYKALTVHKIKGNPNKPPKKKRKKNKKKLN